MPEGLCADLAIIRSLAVQKKGIQVNVGASCIEFLAHCDRERHLASHTLAAYRQDLQEFGRFFVDRAIAKIRGSELVAYAQHLLSHRKLAPATVKRRLACVRTMFARLKRLGRIKANPFSCVEIRIRLPTRLPRCLAVAETKALLTAAAEANASTKLATILLFATGVRISELSSIRAEDIDFDQGSIKIFGKGSRERQVFLSDDRMTGLLREHLVARSSIGRSSWLFTNRLRGRMSADAIRTRIKALARRAGLARTVTPHMIRHTAATSLLEAGVDIRIVQRLLGHQTIATTQIYTHVSDLALRSAIVGANVVGRYAEVLRGSTHN